MMNTYNLNRNLWSGNCTGQEPAKRLPLLEWRFADVTDAAQDAGHGRKNEFNSAA